MRISDWSSDVCSSDLQLRRQPCRHPDDRPHPAHAQLLCSHGLWREWHHLLDDGGADAARADLRLWRSRRGTRQLPSQILGGSAPRRPPIPPLSCFSSFPSAAWLSPRPSCWVDPSPPPIAPPPFP